MRIFVVMAIAGTVVGCGSSTAPISPAVGAWHYVVSDGVGTASNEGDTLTCNGEGLLNVTASGSTLAGTYSGLFVQCTSGKSADTINAGPLAGNIIDGTIGGTTVNFDLGSTGYYNSGNIHNTTMSGVFSALWKISGEGNVTLVGNWSATKLSPVDLVTRQ